MAYLDRVVAELQARTEEVPEEKLAYLSPLEWEHITLTGIYKWNLPDQPAPAGLHPLRGL